MRTLPLESTHRNAEALLGDVNDTQTVLSYGAASGGALRARNELALWDRSHRATLRVLGPDRLSWLQGMITNDVLKLGTYQGCRATVVTSKGRMVAEIVVYVRPDEIWLETSAERAAPLLSHLNRFIIMEDCQVQDHSTQTALFSLIGPKAVSCLRGIAKTLPDLGSLAQSDVALSDAGDQTVIVARSDEFGLEQLDLWVDPSMAAAVWRRLREAGADPVGMDAIEILRIEAGRPRFGAELDEETIPLEAGFKDAIAYDKGCYIGQEIIARVTFRGHVNRELRGLLLEGAPPVSPAPLLRGTETLGELRSSTHSAWLGRTIGLAYVKRDALADGTELELTDGRKAQVCALPFQRPG